jgi:hypothetical protein
MSPIMETESVKLQVVSLKIEKKDYLDDTVFVVPDSKTYKPSRDFNVTSNVTYQHIYIRKESQAV